MRKTSAALATLSLAVLALTGCTSAPSFDGASCDRATNETSTLTDTIETSGKVGTEPDVDVYTPIDVDATQFADAVVGDGQPIVSSTQPFVAFVSIYDGTTGKQVETTGYDLSVTQPRDIASWSQISPVFADVLQCATGGSRVVSAVSSADLGGQAGDGTVVFVFDIADVFLPKAEGTPQFNDARGLPTVVRAPDGTPGVIIPDSAAPKETVVQTLIKGDGPAITENDFAVVNHTILNWDDKSVLGTSWGSSSLVTAPLPEMVGQTVGSQIMVINPATDSAAAQVLVIDILGISSAAPQQQQ